MWTWQHPAVPRYGLAGVDAPDEVLALCMDAHGLFVGLPPPVPRMFTLVGFRPVDTPPLEGMILRADSTDREWLVYDVAVVSRRPVGLTVRAVPDPDGPAEPPAGTVFTVLSLDGQPLGECAALDGFFPVTGPPPRPLRLIGCELSDRLRGAGPVRLFALDRGGNAFDTLLDIEPAPATVLPSAAGEGLVDLLLADGPDDRPVPAAKPIWELWYEGGPRTTGGWIGFDAAGREAWIDAALIHHRRRPDDEPGQRYHLDGAHITEPAGFYCAIGEAVNGPGGYFGGNLDALRDCLDRGWGARAPFTLVWHDSALSRSRLTGQPRVRGIRPASYDEIVEVLDRGGVTVEAQ
jgi:RNAse (barnase) inhibitor barstar